MQSLSLAAAGYHITTFAGTQDDKNLGLVFSFMKEGLRIPINFARRVSLVVSRFEFWNLTWTLKLKLKAKYARRIIDRMAARVGRGCRPQPPQIFSHVNCQSIRQQRGS